MVEKGSVIAIIGGGKSIGTYAKALDAVPCYRIGVNRAWEFFRCNEVVTVDTVDLIDRFKNANCPVYAAVMDDYGRPDAHYPSDRVPMIDKIAYWRNLPETPGLSEKMGTLHSGLSSGYAALGKAYLYKPKRIVMFGIDMLDMGQHWYADNEPLNARFQRQEIIQQARRYFVTTLAQLDAAGIEVINASPISAVECFKKVNVEEGIELCS